MSLDHRTMLGVRRHRIFKATLAGVTAVALAVAVPVVASASSHPAGAATVPTHYLAANGGTVKWTVTVHNVKPAWCTWLSSPKVAGFNTTVKCKTGKVTRSAKFKANTSTQVKSYSITLTVLGKSRTVDRWKVIEAGKPAPVTTTTSTTTTTTTLPPPCIVGTCGVTFTAPDYSDAASLAVGAVVQNAANPDPGVFPTPVGDQLDEVAIGMSAGPTGVSSPGVEVYNFALALVGGAQGTVDTLTFDSSAYGVLGALGPVAADVSFSGLIYFDVPIGSNWSSVNFDYDGSVVYAFLP